VDRYETGIAYDGLCCSRQILTLPRSVAGGFMVVAVTHVLAICPPFDQWLIGCSLAGSVAQWLDRLPC
jgi:hypothetical protein